MSRAAVALAAVAAACDARTGRIPDALTLPALALGLLRRPIAGALGAAACLALPLALEDRAGFVLAGGDLKLLAALGAHLGPVRGVLAELVAYAFLRLQPVRIRQPAAPAIFVGVLVATRRPPC